VGSGEGAKPHPQNIFEIFACEWRILVPFLSHARFFSQLKGGHGPSGPMVNTPLAWPFVHG